MLTCNLVKIGSLNNARLLLLKVKTRTMYSRPSDPRNQMRDQTTKRWQSPRVSSRYQLRHHDTSEGSSSFSRDPRLGNIVHVADGASFPPYHVRGTGGPPPFSIPPPSNLTPPHSSDSSLVRSNSNDQNLCLTHSPHPLFPTVSSTHGHITSHPPPSHHMPPSPQSVPQLPPHGNVSLPPPPPWFNPPNPVFPMMAHPQAPRLHPPPATPPPFAPTPPPTSGAYACPLNAGGLLPPHPPAASPLPFLPPGGLPPPPLPPPPNFPLPLPIMPPPTHMPRFVPPYIQQTQKFHRTPFDPSGPFPGFKPAPNPVGIEEKLGLSEDGMKKEQNEGDGESDNKMNKQLLGGDPSDCFISEWMKKVEGSYLRHHQLKEEVKQNSIKVSG